MEGPQALPPGRALDVGCGTGTNSVYLARHGWRVIGVDYTARAVAAARVRARREGVQVRFLQADVTRLEAGSVEPGVDLVLDMGCFHGVPRRGRPDYARVVGSLAAPGATMLLFCFRAPGGIPGVTDQEVQSVFAPWFDVVRVLPGEGDRNPAWYTLRRRRDASAPPAGPST